MVGDFSLEDRVRLRDLKNLSVGHVYKLVTDYEEAESTIITDSRDVLPGCPDTEGLVSYMVEY